MPQSGAPEHRLKEAVKDMSQVNLQGADGEDEVEAVSSVVETGDEGSGPEDETEVEASGESDGDEDEASGESDGDEVSGDAEAEERQVETGGEGGGAY